MSYLALMNQKPMNYLKIASFEAKLSAFTFQLQTSPFTDQQPHPLKHYNTLRG